MDQRRSKNVGGSGDTSNMGSNETDTTVEPPKADATPDGAFELGEVSSYDKGYMDALAERIPTREQIFDALNGNWFDDDWDSRINLDVTTAGQITDAVLALLNGASDG